MTNSNAGASSPTMTQWASARKISAETLARFGVKPGAAFFPDLARKAEAVFFPYHTASGESAGWKARAVADKAFVASKGFEPRLWNLHRAVKSPVVYLTEGEADALALVEAGCADHEVAALPNASGAGALEDALGDLAGADRFILCMDADDAGKSLRSQVVKILGAGRCEYVDWPEGIKDANEYLIRSSAPKLEAFLRTAKPWPVVGLYRLSDLPEPPPLRPWSCGFDSWIGKLHFAPQTLSVVTGHPGMGKTVLSMQVWAQIVKAYDVAVAVASFETRAKPHHRRNLRSFHLGKPEIAMTAEEMDRADAWIEERFSWLQHPHEKPSLEWILDTAEVAVTRHGCRVLVIDPWNKIESSRDRDETETDYIGRCLDALLDFARDMDVHVQVIAHPAKSEGNRRGMPPTLEDIAGSKNWDNRPDQGVVIHRSSFENEDGSRNYDSTVYVRKARYEELGYPCALPMTYDPYTARFRAKEA